MEVQTRFVTVKLHSGVVSKQSDGTLKPDSVYRRYRDTEYHLQRIREAREASRNNPDNRALSDRYDAEYKALFHGGNPTDGISSDIAA